MLRYLVTGLLFLVCARNLPGAVFLHIEGVPGESTDKSHDKWINIQSFSWGAHKPADSTVNLTGVHFQKKADKSSPLLMLHVAKGQIIPRATLEVIRSNENNVRYLSVRLERVRVANINLDGDSSSESPTETFSLDFTSAQWTYTQIRGERPLRDITTSWDLLSNTGTGGTVPADSDDDGLPDDFESRYGLNPNLADADDDLDEDGMTNLEEFRAGTLPNASDSIFRVSGVRAESGAASLNWETSPGKTYRLMGTQSPDQPFEFIRFLSEAEAEAGELNLETDGNFQFFILQAD